MTTSTAAQLTSSTDAPFGADDPRMVFAQAVALATAVIGRVGPHQLENPTPCPEFDVRALLDHLVTVLRRVAALGRGDDPFGPGIFVPVQDDRHWDAWLAAAHDVQAAWTDDEVLTRTMRLPWAEQSGAAMLISYVNEVTVHTWDLATATGQRPAWDPAVLSVAFDGIRFMPGSNRSAMFERIKADVPPGPSGALSGMAGMQNLPDPFADAVPVPDDAPLIDRLVAWNGRQPC